MEQIGQGGEGSLYLARDLELGTLRAVKILPLSCKREAKLLRLLEHPSLPKMFDFIEKEDSCYLVMEYIKGKSFAQHLKEGRSFSMKEILMTGRTVLEILEYLHTRRPAVCYGDMKPDNLMLSETGRIYLVDFGSAVPVYGDRQRQCKGTAGFAAPEQYQGKISAGSDFYGLGKTLEMLCGRKLWQYILLHPQFGFFVWKCCAPDEQKRWKSAKEAEKYLEKIRPLKLKLRTVLLPAVVLFLGTALFFAAGSTGQKELQPLEQILTPVTAWYYSPDYRSGGKGLRTAVELNIEKMLQRLLKVYGDKKEQIRLLELLAFNGELTGDEEKTEMYYRQLLLYEPDYGNGYVRYGKYLCRNHKTEQSGQILKQWKEKSEKNNNVQKTTDQGALEIWKKEIGQSTEKEKTE